MTFASAQRQCPQWRSGSADKGTDFDDFSFVATAFATQWVPLRPRPTAPSASRCRLVDGVPAFSTAPGAGVDRPILKPLIDVLGAGSNVHHLSAVAVGFEPNTDHGTAR